MMHTPFLVPVLAAAVAAILPAQGPGPVNSSSVHFEPTFWSDGPAFASFQSTVPLVVDGTGLQAILPDRIVHVGLEGGGTGAARGLLPTGGLSHYYVGGKESWRSGVPHYRRVEVDGILPGVKLVCYAQGRDIEFDLELGPDVDPGSVRLAIQGGDGLRSGLDGALVVDVGQEELRLRPPVAYQDLPSGRRRVSSAYRLDADGAVAFVMGDHERDRPLVIDPIIEFSMLLGGSLYDSASDVVVDEDGFTTVVGETGSSDFPMVNPLATQGSGGMAFVMRLDPQDQIVYSTFLGEGSARAVALDSYGNPVVAGHSWGGFPTTLQAPKDTPDGQDWFCAKLNLNGTLLWSTYLGGAGEDSVSDVEVGLGDDVFLAGNSTGGFPTTPNALSGLGFGAVAARLDRFGLKVLFSTSLGFDGTAVAMELTSQNTVYIAGYTSSTSMPVSQGPYPPYMATNPGSSSGFVFAMTPDGASLVVSTYFGGTGDDRIADLFVHRDTNLAADYVTVVGETNSWDMPVANALQPNPDQVLKGFIAQFSHNLGGLRFATYFGGNGQDHLTAIGEDAQGRIYVAGHTDTRELPLVSHFAGFVRTVQGYLMRLDPTGTSIDYATYYGGRSFSSSPLSVTEGMHVEPDGTVTLVGSTNADYIETTTGPTAARGIRDGILVRVSATSLPNYSVATPNTVRDLPILAVAGELTPGSILKIRVRDCAGGQPGILLVGTTGKAFTYMPMLGGTVLVAAPAPVWFMTDGPASDLQGRWDLDVPVPLDGALTGITVNAQAVVLLGLNTVTFTRGVEFTFK